MPSDASIFYGCFLAVNRPNDLGVKLRLAVVRIQAVDFLFYVIELSITESADPRVLQ